MIDDKLKKNANGVVIRYMVIDLWFDEEEDIFLMLELESSAWIWDISGKRVDPPKRPEDFDCGFLWFSDGVKMIEWTYPSQWIYGLN